MTRLTLAPAKRFLPGPILVLLAWEAIAHIFAGAFVIAAPSVILVYLVQNAGLMLRALGVTLSNAALGYILGNAVAILLAGLAVALPRTETMIRALALVVFCLPLVATGPILRVLFGPGEGPQITLAALAVYYTTLVPLLVGLRAVPGDWLDLVRSYGRGRMTVLVRVRAMAAFPYLVAGLQIAAPAAFLGAMVGEFTGAERGMGVLTIRAMRDLNIEMTWALATVATAVAMLIYFAVGAVARCILTDAPPVILAAPQQKSKTVLRTLGTVGLSAAVVVFLWWATFSVLGLSSFFAKRPGDLIDALFLAPDAAQLRIALRDAALETLVFLVPGYLAGLLAGAGLAMALVTAPSLAATALPLAIALRSVPIITTAPLVVLLLGRGAIGTVTLIAIMVFFPTFIACLHGLRQAPGQATDVMRSYAASPMSILCYLRIPAMLPAFFAAARINVPASILAVTVVEWLATGNGLGSLMALSASLSDYDMLWSAVVLTTLMAVIGYGFIGQLERRVLAVYAPEQLT